MARKLAVRMYWMWRKGCDYPQLLKFGSQGSLTGEFEHVIMIEEMVGSNRSWARMIAASLWC
jgi:hypothetical protein